MKSFELHPDRLGTTDEKGHKVFLYPADVRGFWHRHRVRVQAMLVLIFLALPWIHVDGRQFLLLDVASRKFEIFGLSLRAHDAPGLFFVLATAGFSLFFITALVGRIWCGWACPQTVFIEFVFRRIERWIEGPGFERRRLAESPIHAKKFLKKTLKWSLYVLAALLITHSFLAYFVGSRPLLGMIVSDPRENWTSFVFILFTTGLVLFNFGWFREQFCVIACPYGRFQSVLMDEHSTVVGYDQKRGEPRQQKGQPGPFGACVNCYRCVQVCPTGIDIRRGTQLECIACTACVDACDEVMTRLNQPTGLIRYTSAKSLRGEPVQRLRPRTALYGALLLLSLIGLCGFIYLQTPIDVAWLRAKGLPYEVIRAEGREDIVVNRFKIELSNTDRIPHTLTIRPDESSQKRGIETIMAQNPYVIAADRIDRVDVFVRSPKSLFEQGSTQVTILVEEASKQLRFEKELTLVGPF